MVKDVPAGGLPSNYGDGSDAAAEYMRFLVEYRF
jgi:hypothetical protein